MIALLCQTFSQALIIGDYHLRKGVYEAHCVNTDNPEMYCEGHCQMAKEMQKEQNNDKNNPQSRVEIPNVYFISDFAAVKITAFIITPEKIDFPLIQESATSNQPKEIFRPPQNC